MSFCKYHGNITDFNIQNGYAEAIVRGMKSGFLTETEYHHICQCENLEDVKLNLQETDYGNFLADEPSPITPATVRDKATEKLVDEWNYLRAQANQPLAQFMDYITYEYMIQNVIILLKGTISGSKVSVQDLINRCHPLGLFKESIMRSICTFENSPAGYQELYSTVLIDTPVGKYFAQFLHDQVEYGDHSKAGDVRSVLVDISLPILENTVLKYYLEDFYKFTQDLGGDTALIVGDMLKERADSMAINIILNSFGGPLNEASMRAIRTSLLPSFGFLYPEGIYALSNCEDIDSLGKVLQPYNIYYRIFEQCIQSDNLSIDDVFYLNEVRLCENGFDSQFHFACFYAYLHLKQQEIRNLQWICECILQKQKNKIDKYIKIFSPSAPWRNGKLGF
ncbi:hypothetical protein WA158_002209 [Blastocystis sp. Blastoise]